MKTTLFYVALILAAISGCSEEKLTPETPNCVIDSMLGENTTVLGKWTLVETRTNGNVMFGNGLGDWQQICGVDLLITTNQIAVNDRINGKMYSSGIEVKEYAINVKNSAGFYPAFRSFSGELFYVTLNKTDLIITIRTGYEGEGVDYKYKALK